VCYRTGDLRQRAVSNLFKVILCLVAPRFVHSTLWVCVGQLNHSAIAANRNETTGEFQPLVTERHPVPTDLKRLHITDQFNFIKGDRDNSFTATWRTNLAENRYGKSCYRLTEEEKLIVYEKSMKKVRGAAKRMNYFFTEDERICQIIRKIEIRKNKIRKIQNPESKKSGKYKSGKIEIRKRKNPEKK
jgi:hypothetical protein